MLPLRLERLQPSTEPQPNAVAQIQVAADGPVAAVIDRIGSSSRRRKQKRALGRVTVRQADSHQRGRRRPAPCTPFIRSSLSNATGGNMSDVQRAFRHRVASEKNRPLTSSRQPS